MFKEILIELGKALIIITRIILSIGVGVLAFAYVVFNQVWIEPEKIIIVLLYLTVTQTYLFNKSETVGQFNLTIQGPKDIQITKAEPLNATVNITSTEE